MDKPIYIALTCDTDADEFDPSIRFDDASIAPTWRGVHETAPAMNAVCEEVARRYGLRPLYTWFVRVDQQIGYYYGSQTYLLEEYSQLWNDFAGRGHEIGWHPHIYRQIGLEWSQECDEAAFCSSLEGSYESFKKHFGPPRCSRIGEARFSNAIAETLDGLGITCDSSAMPGRYRVDADRCLDWRGTAQHPYFPSCQDYRLEGAQHRDFLEVPMSMVPVKAAYDPSPFVRYVDLSFHRSSLEQGLHSFIQTAELLVTMTHPSGLLPSREHGLISFSVENYRANLDLIFSLCEQFGRRVEMITLGECRTLFGRLGEATAPPVSKLFL